MNGVWESDVMATEEGGADMVYGESRGYAEGMAVMCSGEDRIHRDRVCSDQAMDGAGDSIPVAITVGRDAVRERSVPESVSMYSA